MPDFPIVAKRFAPDEFGAYLGSIALAAFRPSMVVLHNTAVPTLADRPSGFTTAQMADLEHYYAHVQGWSGGPHLFVDDNGIWAFNLLDRRGVHSPSWNSISWGVEMLGDYEREPFDSGRGAKVRSNAVAAVAAMLHKLRVPPSNDHFKLHHEDPKTTHACPGKLVGKEAVRVLLTRALGGAQPPSSSGHSVRIVAYRKGQGNVPVILDGHVADGVTSVDAAAWSASGLGATKDIGVMSLRALTGDRYDVTPRMEQDKVYLVER